MALLGVMTAHLAFLELLSASREPRCFGKSITQQGTEKTNQ